MTCPRLNYSNILLSVVNSTLLKSMDEYCDVSSFVRQRQGFHQNCSNSAIQDMHVSRIASITYITLNITWPLSKMSVYYVLTAAHEYKLT